MSDSNSRPNIRIEIQNNLADSMEVDENYEEEGEITETVEDIEEEQEIDVPVDNNKTSVTRQVQRVWPNANGGFTTGINIFDKTEQTKLVERAKRFALDPTEIRNFTDEQLQELHDSLGITVDEEKDIRFEALHMRGTDEMSTEDVLEYFGKYGPAGVEWINDESCNIIWNDRVSAARALFFLSKKIEGMPIEGPCDPFIKELEKSQEAKTSEGTSILLRKSFTDDNLDDTISVDDITVPIPPGYWRKGIPHPKSRCILLRFSFKSDKKQMGAERFSDYYKKYGNPNYGGMKGLISDTQKKRFKGIFDRNPEIETAVDNKNPWGALASTWNEENRAEPPPILERNDVKTARPANKSDIMSRIGHKRHVEEDQEEKRTKVPRMRMYADEEEEKIKRRRELQKLKNETKQPVSNDLRTILNIQGRRGDRDEIDEEEDERIKAEEPDLGLLLKNRNKPKEERNEREDRNRRRSPDRQRFHRRMRSDEEDFYHSRRHREDAAKDNKPKSKVAVVIKTQKKPAVASTVWSRINPDGKGLKEITERKLRRRESSRSSSVETENDDDSGSKSSDGEIDDVHVKVKTERSEAVRPGFHANLQARLHQAEHKSPLRIEIANNHFKKE